MIQKPIWIMFDATQMPFYVKNNLILFKIDDQRNWARWIQKHHSLYYFDLPGYYRSLQVK